MLRRNFFAAIAAPVLAKFIPDGKHFPKKDRTFSIIAKNYPECIKYEFKNGTWILK